MDEPAANRLSAKRKAIYALVTVLGFLLLAELVSSLGGVSAFASSEDPYVGFAQRLPLFVAKHDANGIAVMETARNKLRFFNRQSFLQTKPANGYRIFCLGGSTTYGHPYTARTSFCGWLQAFLNRADPSRTWEVVNAGGISYASYRITALMEELVRYQPDLFIVYSGHNEFIEERTYREIRELPRPVVELNAILGHSRFYSALRSVVDKTMTNDQKPFLLAPEVNERLGRSIGPVDYHRDDALRAGVIKHYRFNLSRMVSLARRAGSQIMFITPSSNLKDMSPFKSEHRADLTREARLRWDAQFEQARAMTDLATKRSLLDELVASDPVYAEAHYERGRVLLDQGDFAQAREAFTRALDEDILPLRILPEMLADLRAVARDEGVPLVDFEAMIGALSQRELGHDIPGKEFFLDHVHLNIEAYRLLALELLQRLIESGLVRPDADWGEEAVASITRQLRDSLTAKDHGNAIMTVAIVLGWGGRLEESHRLLLQAYELLGDDPVLRSRLVASSERRNKKEEGAKFMTRLPLASRAQAAEDLVKKGEWGRAVESYRELVGLLPQDAAMRLNLAIAYENSGQRDKALQTYEEARRLDSQRPEPYIGLANLYEEQGEMEKARGLYRDAVAKAPDDAGARINLGVNLARSRFLDEAIIHFKEAVRIAPERADAHFNLAQALKQQHRDAEAATHLREAERLGAKPVKTGR
jgi:tetratricopeptide (TPR) repeat protein